MTATQILHEATLLLQHSQEPSPTQETHNPRLERKRKKYKKEIDGKEGRVRRTVAKRNERQNRNMNKATERKRREERKKEWMREQGRGEERRPL